MKIIIQNCNVIDAIGNEPLPNCSVLLDGNIIAQICSCTDDLPEVDVVIDAKDKYLLPGMINLHVHIQRRHLARGSAVFRSGAPYIENSPDPKRMLWAMNNAWQELSIGVTTIRDCGSKNRMASQLRDAITEGIIRGPRVISCGFGIASTGGHETHRYQGAIEVDGPNEVRKAVRGEIKAGANFIKLMASGGLGGMPEHEHPGWVEFSVAEMTAAVEEAHNRNKGVTVHAMGENPVLNSLYAGVDGVEHGAKLTDEALEIMIERGTYYVPTMSGITAVAEKEEKQGNKELAKLMCQEVVYPQRKSVSKAHSLGILIGCGTDTLGDMVNEMKLLQQCGLSTMECIQTATSNASKIVSLENKIGTVEAGKIADLLLLNGNPLEDLEQMRNIHMVISNGEIVTNKWLCGF